MDFKEKQAILLHRDRYSSYEVAERLAIKITYFPFPDEVLGYYTPMLSKKRLVINIGLSLEQQERVCDHMIVHCLMFESVSFCIDTMTYAELEKRHGSGTAYLEYFQRLVFEV